MKLEVATLVAGSETPAEDGITGAMRCVLLLPDKSRRSAVLKRGSTGQVVSEAFSALLLRAWGLPVPDPYLVDESGIVSFASADVGYPNLKHRLGLEALPVSPARDAVVRIATELVCSLPTTPLAAACDEVIDNRDRNLGNILWDGEDEAWIDHAFALGQGIHLPDQNKLCTMAVGTPHQEQFTSGAVTRALLLDKALPQRVDEALSASPLGQQSLALFVAVRITSLGSRLIARFPRPADLLSQA